MAVASVTTNIVIKGQDDASAAINKASKSAKGLTGALEGVQAKAQGLTGSLRSMVSGDVLGGVKGLGGSLGGGSGLAGQAALAAAGIAGIGVALGAAAIKITEWSIELERMRAQMRFAFAGGEREAFAFADAIGGVGVESAVKLSTTLKAAGVDGKVTAEQLQRLANAATAMGKTGDDALSAFADSVRSGSTEALKQVGVFVNGELAIKQYAKQLGISSEQMTAAQRSQAVLNATLAAVPGLAQAGTNTYAEQDNALSRLANTTTRWKLELSDLAAGPALRILKSVEELTSSFGGLEETLKTLAKTAAIPLRGMASGIERIARAGVLLKRGDLGEAALAAGEAIAKLGTMGLAQGVDDLAGALSTTGERQQDVADKTKAATKAIEVQGATVGGLVTVFGAFDQAAKKMLSTTHKVRKAAAGKAGMSASQLRADAVALRDRDLAAQQAAARDPAQAAQIEQMRVRLHMLQQIAEASEKYKNHATLREQAIATITAEGNAKIAASAKRLADQRKQEAEAATAKLREAAAATEEYRDRVLAVHQTLATSPAAAAQIEQQRIQLDMQRQIEEAKRQHADNEMLRQQAIATITIEANARIAESTKRLAEIEAQAAQQRTDQAFGVANAVAQGLGMIEGAERAQAGLQAAIEVARSIQSFASYDFAAGAQHAVAAAAFAKVALTPKPAAPAGAQQQRQIAEPTRGVGGGGNTVINISGVMTTKAEVGAAIKSALSAVGKTGMATS